MKIDNAQSERPNAIDRLCRDNNLKLVWSRERQKVELRPAFVPIETPGYDMPDEAA